MMMMEGELQLRLAVWVQTRDQPIPLLIGFSSIHCSALGHADGGLAACLEVSGDLSRLVWPQRSHTSSH